MDKSAALNIIIQRAESIIILAKEMRDQIASGDDHGRLDAMEVNARVMTDRIEALQAEAS